MPEIVRITPSQGYVDFLNNDVSNYLTNMIRFDGDASSTPYVVRLTAGVTNPGTSGATFNGATPVMIMTDDGRFGIGISSIPDARLEIASGTTSIGQVKLNPGSLLSSTADGILEYNGTHLYFTIGTTRYQIDQQSGGGGSGTVTSVDMTVPTGFAISGNPITTTGTLALAFDTGYSLPTTASQTNWNTAYGWGDHSTAGYLTASLAASTYVAQTRTLSINGVQMDLSADREWHTGYADTGVFDFAGISIVSSTQVDVGALTGIITDNETNPNNPTHTHVSYAGGTNITVPTIASGIISYLLIDDTGTLVWQNTYPTSAERKSMIFLGRVSHPDLTSLFLAKDTVDYLISPMAYNRDFIQAIKFINDNVYPYPNNTNLELAITTGNIHGNGINFTTDNTKPNEFSITGSTSITFRYVTQDGTLGSATTDIDPANYDVGGTVTAITATGQRSTIQYVFAVPTNSGIQYIIQYGQVVYNTLASAVSALGKENFVLCPGLEGCGVLIGVIILRYNTTDLTDDVYAHIFKADKFGQLIGAQSSVSTGTLQKAYDNSEIPQITVNPTQGALTIKSGMVANTDTIQSWQNISGTEVAFITGEGKLDLNGLRLTLGSDATGDIFYRNSSGYFQRLGVGTNGQVLTLSAGLPSWATPTTGTVTSVDMTVPTGLSISGNPITSSGTLALTFTAGYSIPTTASQSNWDTAFSWGNHASAGYLLASTAATTYQPLDSDLTAIAALTTTAFGRGLLTETSASTLRSTLSLVVGTNVQAWDADLDAIAALAGTSGLLRKTATNTWSLDTTAYIDNTVTTLSSLTTVGTLTSGSISTGFVVGGVTMTLGSDATGDIYYRNTGGILTRLAVGSAGQLLTVSSGLPAWQTLTTTIAIGTTPITSGGVGRIIFEGTGNVAQENANFIWDNTNTRLGVGLSSPNATLDVKGIGTTSSTSSLIVSNSTPTEIFRIYDSKNINIGGGTVTSGTDYKITAFGAGALSTDTTLLISGASGDNIFTFFNTPGYSAGGLTIKRSTLSSGRTALSVVGNTSITFSVTSDGTINLNNTPPIWVDYDGNYIQTTTSASHGAGVQGVLYNTFGGGSTASHIFRKGRGTVSPGTGAIVHLYSNYIDSGTTSSNTTYFLKIAPIVNLTGSGTKHVVGIHYAPTMTSLTGGGTNIAMLLESGNSGFGMSTAPTARIHVAAGTATAGTAPIKINSGTNMTTPEDGAMEYNGTHLYFTIGSTRYQLDQQSSTGTVTSVGLSVPTGFAVTGSPVTTSGTLALAFDTGYSLPTTASQTNWNTAYGWGNHATAGYEVALTFSTGLTRSVNTITNNLSTGISGGQSVIGGIAASETLTLSSTSHATKGKILFGTSAYDEANNRLGINTTTPGAMIEIAAGTTSEGILLLNVGSLLTSAVLGTFEYSLVGSNNVLHFTRQGTTRESVLTGLSGATAPGTTPATTVNNYYGSAGNVMLGEPATWIQVIDESGVVRKIPAY